MSHTVVAELVAAVMKVEVEVGSKVAADDPVVILESMKMEIPVLAEVDGTVSKLAVKEGGLVQEGDLIAEIS
jgi:acetyl-CoA carboxylase biotin carboxyl carrier protein